MAIYPVATLYPGNTDAYPAYASHPWTYNGTQTGTYGGTATYSYSTSQIWSYS